MHSGITSSTDVMADMLKQGNDTEQRQLNDDPTKNNLPIKSNTGYAQATAHALKFYRSALHYGKSGHC